jgi:phage gpG-like protein
MFRLRVDITGLDKTNATLDKLSGIINNLEPELVDVGTWLMGFLQVDVFDTEGGAISAPWQALSSPYSFYKSKNYPGRAILEASGEMRKGYALMTTTQYAIVENTVEYAKYHQSGTSRLPQRMLVNVTDELKRTVGQKFADHLKSRVEQATR